MASPDATFTIRNLTSTLITLRLIERFEDPNGITPKSSYFSSNDTTPAAPSGQQLSDHAQSFSQQNLDISLSPYESHVTNLKPTDSSLKETLRLTIEAEGHKYRVDINSTSARSSYHFKPLVPNPSHHLTTIFHPQPSPHLSIHTLPEPETWMSTLPSSLPLSALSIPGTHNSATYHRALPSVRCQVHSVSTQLNHGIRFLDIRVQPYHASSLDVSKKHLYLVHGAFPISLTGPKYLEPILQTCYDFLEAHPTETIIVSLKREGVGNSTDEHLSQVLEKHYITPSSSKWYTSPRIPSLGQVRGKMVLMRRFVLHPDLKAQSEENEGGFGLDAECWAYNCSHDIHGSVCVQDFCEVLEPNVISTKLSHCNAHLDRAAQCSAMIPGVNTDKENPVPPGPLYLNFLSASNFWKVGCWPDRIAKRLNPGVLEFMCKEFHADGERKERVPKEGDGGTGIIVMDCVGEGGDWDLVRVIVGMNGGLLARGKEERWET